MTDHTARTDRLGGWGLDAEPVLGAGTHPRRFWRRFMRHKLAMGSALFLAVCVVVAVFAEAVAPYAYDEINVQMAGTGPTLEAWHVFGTDQLGRDYFSRVIYALRTSLQVAVIVAVVSTMIGTTVGAVAGFYRGWVDSLLMRATDLVLILPALAVLLTAAAFFGGGNPRAIGLLIAAVVWVTLARIVRATFLGLREKEFVDAARLSGASDLRIMLRHMLPNALGPIIVNATLVTAVAILFEATLAFLGFGVAPPTPALGLLIENGRSSMTTQWWLVVMPGSTLVAICLAVNFLGDGLRDALDPTQRDPA